MKWVQVLNMVAAAYVVAIAAIMVIAMVAEPDTLRDYTGQTIGLVSIAAIGLFIACALYVGVRTIWQAIRSFYAHDEHDAAHSTTSTPSHLPATPSEARTETSSVS